MSVGKQIIKGMKEFLKKLKSGEPIEATRVERHETPDGPMHVQEKVLLLHNYEEGKPVICPDCKQPLTISDTGKFLYLNCKCGFNVRAQR